VPVAWTRSALRCAQRQAPGTDADCSETSPIGSRSVPATRAAEVTRVSVRREAGSYFPAVGLSDFPSSPIAP